MKYKAVCDVRLFADPKLPVQRQKRLALATFDMK
jgi:hypothetical protein